MNARAILAAVLAAGFVLQPAVAQQPGAEVPDEEQLQQREEAQKLRRARDELEARHAEALRRLEENRVRNAEIVRLQGIDARVARRESYLGHEAYWTQRERDSLSRDPADLSAMARRSGLDHQLYQYQNELDRAGPLRQGATIQLDGLRLR